VEGVDEDSRSRPNGVNLGRRSEMRGREAGVK